MYEKSGIVWELSIRSFLLPLLGGICNSAATFSRKPVFALRPRGPRHRIAAAPSAVSSTCFQTFHFWTRAGQGRLPACRQAGAAIGMFDFSKNMKEFVTVSRFFLFVFPSHHKFS